jgi:nitroreductase
MDIAFAVSFMTLQAEHEGFSSAILGTYNESAIKDLLSVPNAMRIVLLLVVGKTSEERKLSERFPSSRIISYDHW